MAVDALHQRLITLFAVDLKFDIPSIDTDLFETGVLDSLAFVELLLHLEREFGVRTSVDDLEVENFRSIARIAEFVLDRTAVEPRVATSRPAVALGTAG